VSSPTKNGGIVTINENDNDTLIFVPATDFIGIDAFSYEVSDGKGKSDKAKVSVIVVKPPIVVDSSSKPDQETERQTEISKKQHLTDGGEEDDNVQAQNQANSNNVPRSSDGDDVMTVPHEVENSGTGIPNESNENNIQ
jgi:hypothetical protein